MSLAQQDYKNALDIWAEYMQAPIQDPQGYSTWVVSRIKSFDPKPISIEEIATALSDLNTPESFNLYSRIATDYNLPTI